MHTERQNQGHLGDVVRRASQEIRSWPAWAQPFRPSGAVNEETARAMDSSSREDRPSPVTELRD